MRKKLLIKFGIFILLLFAIPYFSPLIIKEKGKHTTFISETRANQSSFSEGSTFQRKRNVITATDTPRD